MTTSISCRSDSKSDHNKGSTKNKSDVVSTESSRPGPSSDVTATSGGPVLSLIDKRLRNHRKKLNRILQMEQFLSQGKPLNKEQAQLLQSKPAVSALIDELEKVRKPLASAVSEEISRASKCHAISAENSPFQDQDQGKASEEKEFKAHKELPIDSRSDHNEGSSKIKSDVDVTDNTLVGDFVLSLINKRLRNHRKKLNRILQMEEFLARGKPLNKEQAQLLQSKSAVSALIDELEKLRNLLASAVSEEISLTHQCHAISGKNGTCQDQDQEEASEKKEFKAHKELPIDPKSDHDGSTKDVMSTECGRPCQVDQQNEGIALPLSDPKSDHDGSTKDVMSTECGGPSQVDQQNEGIALPLNDPKSDHDGSTKDVVSTECGRPCQVDQQNEGIALPLSDTKSDHNGSTKDVMSTGCGGPSQVDQQNEGIDLPLRTDMKQTDRNWKILCKDYLDENARLLEEKAALGQEFKRLKLSSLLSSIRISLLKRRPKINCNFNADQKEGNSLIDQQDEDDQGEENSLIDQQNEEFPLSPWEAERLGISKNHKMEEGDWERCCQLLSECNMWLKEQLREYKIELDVIKELAVEFPELIGGKPADTSEELWTVTDKFVLVDSEFPELIRGKPADTREELWTS